MSTGENKNSTAQPNLPPPPKFLFQEHHLLLFAAAVGLFGGLGAQFFLWLLNLTKNFFLIGIAGYAPPDAGVPNPTSLVGPWGLWLVPAVTTLGGFLSGVVSQTFSPNIEARNYHRMLA